MRRIPIFFFNIKIRNKMVISYIFLALIPFVVFAVVSANIFVAQARATVLRHTTQITGQVSNSIDVYISTIEKMANYISLTLQNNYTPDSLNSLLSNIAYSHPEIAGILIAMSNDEFVSTGMSRISRDAFSSELWYQSALQQPDKIVLISNATGRNIVTNKSDSIDDVFSLAKAVKDPVTNEILCVLLFDIRHTIIRESINRVSIGKKGFAFVLDGNNNMVYAPNNDIVYRVDPSWLSVGESEPITAKIGNGRYQIRYDQSEYTDWKTVGVFSLDEVMSGVNTITYILIFSILLTGALVLLTSFWLAFSVTKPISKLRSLMQQAESGDLSVRFNSLYNDEIGDLTNSFNHMIGRMDFLIQQVYAEQKSKRDMELKALQEQIKPHFLYNTLDTIGFMARNYEADDIVRLVDSLTSMFRIGLSQGRDFISVEEESIHVSNYLSIQQVRYKDKLQYEIHIDKQMYPNLIPKLILQPLVENSIYHGIKQKRGIGNIIISGVLDGQGNQIFSVRDDGAGMNTERLEKLRNQLRHNNPDKPGFGLYYISERIRLCYGEEYGVEFESTEGVGTTVSIKLPLANPMATSITNGKDAFYD